MKNSRKDSIFLIFLLSDCLSLLFREANNGWMDASTDYAMHSALVCIYPCSSVHFGPWIVNCLVKTESHVSNPIPSHGNKLICYDIQLYTEVKKWNLCIDQLLQTHQGFSNPNQPLSNIISVLGWMDAHALWVCPV